MKVSAIIPAFNEQNTICKVLEIVKQNKSIDEVLVVNDGSTDDTGRVCKQFQVEVINLEHNVGKSQAMKIGEQKCTGDVLLFLDADLIGLNDIHINDLVMPILNSNTDMTVGVFASGRFTTDFAHKVAPFLSGQRAIRKDVFNSIADADIQGYGIETALTVYGEKGKIKVATVELNGLTHVMKEEKMGLFKGFCARMKMYRDIYDELRIARRKQM